MANFIYNELDEFKKEFKNLSKKYKSLKDDFEDLKKVIEVFPKWKWQDIKNHKKNCNWKIKKKHYITATEF